MLTGEALVGEHARLRERVQRLFARFEASVRQSLKVAQQQGGVAAGFDPAERARWLLTYASGSLALRGRVDARVSSGGDEGALLALLG